MWSPDPQTLLWAATVIESASLQPFDGMPTKFGRYSRETVARASITATHKQIVASLREWAINPTGVIVERSPIEAKPAENADG